MNSDYFDKNGGDKISRRGDYETVVGLETHVELSTKSKIFCSCPTAFGGEPNTRCCPVCVGLPGSLPRLNAAVVEYAIKAGLALGCRVNNESKMDRKNYVYPDLPKAYQISQFDSPLCSDGSAALSDGAVVRINRIHIEEDAGKLIHRGGERYIDYNRGGVPLIEIVTEPDFRSSAQVREYIEKLRLIMRCLDVSDCRMQEGSMRCDVNVSVRRRGETKFGVRAEIKNMNSVAFIVKAIDYESKRQIDAILNGEPLIQETRRYDESSGETMGMRGKEDSDDYRYFKDPDLPYVRVTDEYVEEIRRGLPELPDKKAARYAAEFGLSPAEIEPFTRRAGIGAYFEELARLTNNPKQASNIVLSHVLKRADDEDAVVPAPAGYLAEVVAMVQNGEISGNFLKPILDKILDTGKPFGELFTKGEFAAASGDDAAAAVDKAVAENAAAVASYLFGREKAFKALVGAVMRETKGKADPALVDSLLRKKLDEIKSSGGETGGIKGGA